MALTTPHLPVPGLDRPDQRRMRRTLGWAAAVAAVAAAGVLTYSVIDTGSTGSDTTDVSDIGPGLREHGSIAAIDHAEVGTIAQFNDVHDTAINDYRGQGSTHTPSQTLILHGSVAAIDHATGDR